jgi:hypothetical protein
MHSRGSGFFSFSYATLALGLLLSSLIFFAVPSKAGQVASLIIVVILLIDMILIVSVPRIRDEERWVGITSVVWALLISIWIIFADRIVAWGKREEEERLTGRSESRRTVREWCSVLTSTVVLVIMVLITILLTATLILRARDASLPAPGDRFSVDGAKYQIHLFCEGNSTTNSKGKKLPTVLFEAADSPFENGMIQIATSALTNGSIGRYCYADRPGIGWSDNAPSPFAASNAADSLSEALTRAGEEAPWILASAGIGSIYSRVFSAHQGTDVAGLLMIDPLHEDLLHRVGIPRRGFALWGWGILSPLGLQSNFGALFKGRTREDRVYGRASYQVGKYIKAKLQESLVAESVTKHQAVNARHIQSKDTPLSLISSGIMIRQDTDWGRKQRDLSHYTDNLTSWDIVDHAPAEVWKTFEGRQTIEKRLAELVHA